MRAQIGRCAKVVLLTLVVPVFPVLASPTEAEKQETLSSPSVSAQPGLVLRFSLELSPLKPVAGAGLSLGKPLAGVLGQPQPQPQPGSLSVGDFPALLATPAMGALGIPGPMPLASGGQVPILRLALHVGEGVTGREGEWVGISPLPAEGGLVDGLLWPTPRGDELWLAAASKEAPADAPALLVPTRLTFGGLAYTDYQAAYAQDKQVATTRTSGASANVMGQGYLWQPWLAGFTMNLGVSGADTGRTTGSDSNTYSLTGSAGLSLFPSSFFPSNFSVNRTTTESLGVSTSRQEMNQFTYTQQLRPPGANSSYSLGYNRSVNTAYASSGDNVGNQSIYNSYTLSAVQNLFGEVFNISGAYVTDYREAMATQPETRSNLLNANINNLFRIDEFSSLQSDAAMSASSYYQGGTKLNSTAFYQAGGNYTWRSEDMPMNGNLSFRGSWLEIDNQGKIFLSNQTVIGGNVNYNYSSKLTLGASANSIRSNSSRTFAGNLVANYQGDSRLFQGFSHSWSGSARAGYQGGSGITGSSGSGNVSIGAGQSIGRSWQDVLPGMLFFNANQSVSTSMGETGVTTVSHGANSGWSWSRGLTQLNVSANATDTRSLGNSNTSSQQISLQVGGSRQIGRNSRLTANVNSRMGRQVSETKDNADFEYATSLQATYDNSRFLSVPRLYLTSNLTATLVPELQRATRATPGLPFNLNWENRLSYFLGRTQFQAQASATSVDGVNSGLIYFKVERRFGY